MLEKVIVRIIHNISNVVLDIGVLVVGFSIIGKIFGGIDFHFINYCNSWSELFGSYGFLKVLIITVVALIIYLYHLYVYSFFVIMGMFYDGVENKDIFGFHINFTIANLLLFASLISIIIIQGRKYSSNIEKSKIN